MNQPERNLYLEPQPFSARQVSNILIGVALAIATVILLSQILVAQSKQAVKPETLKPIPVLQEDTQKLVDLSQQIRNLTAQLNAVAEAARWHACLNAGVSKEECGPLQSYSEVARLPKPAPKSPEKSKPAESAKSEPQK